jgi:hypothetical protein
MHQDAPRDKQMRTYQSKSEFPKGCLNAMAIQAIIITAIIVIVTWIR